MASRKLIWVLFGVLVISAWVLGSAIQAGAETLKGRTVLTTTKLERIPAGFEEGHFLAVEILEGLTLFENGEIARSKVTSVWDGSKDGLQSIGYTVHTFQDGSTIVQRFQRLRGEGGFAKQTAEFINGTGRFEGIKGTGSSTGKTFLPTIKGEAASIYADFTWTYTLPTK